MISLRFPVTRSRARTAKRMCSKFCWFQDSKIVPVFIYSALPKLTLGSGFIRTHEVRQELKMLIGH